MSERQIVSIVDKNKLTLNNLIEAISFTDEAITLYTGSGNLKVAGKGLSLDCAEENGNAVITGNISSIIFFDNKEKLSENFIARLFR